MPARRRVGQPCVCSPRSRQERSCRCHAIRPTGGGWWRRCSTGRPSPSASSTPASGEVLARITDGRGAVHDASWADATHVVYLGADDARGRLSGLPGRPAERPVTPAHARPLPGVRAADGRPEPAVPQPRRVALDARRADGEPGARARAADGNRAALRNAPPPAPQPASAPVLQPSPYPYPYPPAPFGRHGRCPSTTARSRSWSTRPTGRPIICSSLQTHGIDLVTAGRSAALGDPEPGRRRPIAVPPLGTEWDLAALRGSARLRRRRRPTRTQLFAPFSFIVDAMALRYHDTWPVPRSPLVQPTLTPAPFVLEKTILQADARHQPRSFYGAPAARRIPHLRRRSAGRADVAGEAPPRRRPVRAGDLRRARDHALLRRAASPHRGAVAEYLSGRLEHNRRDADRRDASSSWASPRCRCRTGTGWCSISVGRDLFGLPPGARWLQVGGGLSALAVSRRPDTPVPPEVTDRRAAGDHLPRAAARLRGLSDRHRSHLHRGGQTTATRSSSTEARRPPLWLLPSSFLRQIDLELFGSAATDAHGGPGHAAGGTAVTLEMAIWDIQVNLTYQLARRVEDDQALVQIVALGAQ